MLARHGETEWNLNQRLQGQLDSPLTSIGIQQIEKLADELSTTYKENRISRIFSSPLGRAKHSSTILQKRINQPIKELDFLKERSFGLWQGKLFEDIKQDHDFAEVFFKVSDTPIPQGESAIQARKRMTSGLKVLGQHYQNQKLLIVTHGELLRCFLSGLENSVDGSAYELFKNGKVFEVNYSPVLDQFKVKFSA